MRAMPSTVREFRQLARDHGLGGFRRPFAGLVSAGQVRVVDRAQGE
jgi:hypothetical protein